MACQWRANADSLLDLLEVAKDRPRARNTLVPVVFHATLIWVAVKMQEPTIDMHKLIVFISDALGIQLQLIPWDDVETLPVPLDNGGSFSAGTRKSLLNLLRSRHLANYPRDRAVALLRLPLSPGAVRPDDDILQVIAGLPSTNTCIKVVQ